MTALKITTAKFAKAHAASTQWNKQPPRAGQADAARTANLAAQLAEARKGIDADAITAVIQKTNGRCTRNTITLFGAILAFAIEAETNLEKAGVPVKLRTGATYRYRAAGPSARAYKGQMNVSDVMILRASDGWRLKSYAVAEVYPRTSEICVMTVSADAKAAIVQQALQGFAVAA